MEVEKETAEAKKKKKKTMEERHEKESHSHRRSATVDGGINVGIENSHEKDQKQQVTHGSERSKGSSSSKKATANPKSNKQQTVPHLPTVTEKKTPKENITVGEQSKPNLSKSLSLNANAKVYGSARKPIVQNILKIEEINHEERQEVNVPFRTTRSQSLRLEGNLEGKIAFSGLTSKSIADKQTESRKEEKVNDQVKDVEEDKPPFCLDFKPEGDLEYKKRLRKNCTLNNNTTFKALPLPKFYQERDQERTKRTEGEEEEEEEDGKFLQKSSVLKPLHLRSSSRGKCLQVPEVRKNLESKSKSPNISRSKSASGRITSRTTSKEAKETIKKLQMREGGSRKKEDKKKSTCVVAGGGEKMKESVVISSAEENVNTVVAVGGGEKMKESVVISSAEENVNTVVAAG